jgi:hypothetical protein
VVVLRIVRWNPQQAWVEWPTYYLGHLEGNLARYTDLDKMSIKHVARRIRDRECLEIRMREGIDEYSATPLRSSLECVGAEVVAEMLEQ